MMDFDFERQERRSRIRRIVFRVLLWLIVLGSVIALAAAINLYAIEVTNMVGSSMEPTLFTDDTIIINKFSYLKDSPERFDVIVFKKDGKEHSYYGIARIIGLPGETIRITDGCIYVNGSLLEEEIIFEPMTIGGLAEEDLSLDEDEYFVLSDNRNNGQDSRFTNIGNVVDSEIIGKAFIRTNRFAIINKINAGAKEDSKETK